MKYLLKLIVITLIYNVGLFASFDRFVKNSDLKDVAVVRPGESLYLGYGLYSREKFNGRIPRDFIVKCECLESLRDDQFPFISVIDPVAQAEEEQKGEYPFALLSCCLSERVSYNYTLNIPQTAPQGMKIYVIGIGSGPMIAGDKSTKILPVGSSAPRNTVVTCVVKNE